MHTLTTPVLVEKRASNQCVKQISPVLSGPEERKDRIPHLQESLLTQTTCRGNHTKNVNLSLLSTDSTKP